MSRPLPATAAPLVLAALILGGVTGCGSEPELAAPTFRTPVTVGRAQTVPPSTRPGGGATTPPSTALTQGPPATKAPATTGPATTGPVTTGPVTTGPVTTGPGPTAAPAGDTGPQPAQDPGPIGGIPDDLTDPAEQIATAAELVRQRLSDTDPDTVECVVDLLDPALVVEDLADGSLDGKAADSIGTLVKDCAPQG